jgi:tetratricopeptide (TPR) repeat protein
MAPAAHAGARLPRATIAAPAEQERNMTVNSAPASYEELLSRATAASQVDDSARAIALFVRASEARPAAGLPHFMLGSEYAALGEFGKAETAFANATRLAPDFPLARYQLGLLQFSSGRAAVALLTWQALLELPGTNPLPHFVHGFESLAQDRFDEALASFRKGLALNTDNPPLSGDIEKVIARIEAMGHDAVRHEEAATEVAAESHVLLAAYQQQGTLH